MNPIGYNEIVSDNVEKGIKTLITLLEQFNDVLKSGDNIYTETLNTLKIEIDSVNKSMKDLNSTAQKKNDYTEKEITELKQLAAELEKLKADYDNLKNAQAQATAAQKQNSQATEETAGSIAHLKKQLADLNKQKLNATEAELKNLGAEASKVQTEIKRLENVFKSGGTAARSLAGSYDELSNRNRELKRALKELPDVFGANAAKAEQMKIQIQANDKTLKEFDKTIGESFRNVGNYESAFDGLLGKLSGEGGLVGGLATFATGAGAAMLALDVLIGYFKDLSQSIAETNKNISQTGNITGLTGTNLDDFTSKVAATAKTFNKEYNEVLLAANAIAKNFGITQTKAIDLINKGFLKGGDIQGNYLDKLTEYSSKLKGATIDADKFFKVVLQGDRSGINQDKLLMAYEEAILSLKEYTKAQEDAIKGAFGEKFNATLKKGLNNGTITVEKALDMIAKKAQQTGLSIAQQQTLIADIFKSGGEEIGNLNDIFNALAESQKIDLDNLDLRGRKLQKDIKATQEHEQSIIQLTNALNSFGFSTENIATKASTYFNIFIAKALEWAESAFSVFDSLEEKQQKAVGKLQANLSNDTKVIASELDKQIKIKLAAEEKLEQIKAKTFKDPTKQAKEFNEQKKILDFETEKLKILNEQYDKLNAPKEKIKTTDAGGLPIPDKTPKATKIKEYQTINDLLKKQAELQNLLSLEIEKGSKQRPEFIEKTRSELEKVKKLLLNPFDIAVTFNGESTDFAISVLDTFAIQAEDLKQKQLQGLTTEGELKRSLLELDKQRLEYQILQAEQSNASVLDIEKLKTQLATINKDIFASPLLGFSTMEESILEKRLKGIITEKEAEQQLFDLKKLHITQEIAEKERLKQFDKKYYTLKNDLLQLDVDKQRKAFTTVYNNYTNFVNKFVKDSDTKVLLNLLGSVIKGAYSIKKGDKSVKDSILDTLSSFGGFSDGGYTGSGAKYDPAGIVHKGEVVFSQENIKRLGGVSNVENIRNLNFDSVNLGKFYEPLRNIESKPLQVMQAPQIDIDSLAVAIGRNMTKFDIENVSKNLILSVQNSNLVNRLIVKKQRKSL